MAKKKFEMNKGGVVKDMYFSATDVVTPVVTVSSTGDVTQALDAGKFYKFGTVDSLTLTLNAPTACADCTVPLAMYGGKFTASVDDMNIGFPTGVNLTDEDNDNISIAADHTYEFNIMDGIIYIKDVTVTIEEDVTGQEEEAN